MHAPPATRFLRVTRLPCATRVRSVTRALGAALAVARDWGHAATQQVRALASGVPADGFTHPVTQHGRGPAAPVVLIPGIWETWRYLEPLARSLHDAGHEVHPVQALGWNGADLPHSVARVRRHLEAQDLRGVVLVAHSKGGLIGKQLLLDPRTASRVIGLVAINTPFDGSSLSLRWLAGTPLGMFHADGAVISQLASERQVNARITSITSSFDEMIPQGSRPTGARHVDLDRVGHFLPLVDPKVLQIVHREVDRLALG